MTGISTIINSVLSSKGLSEETREVLQRVNTFQMTDNPRDLLDMSSDSSQDKAVTGAQRKLRDNAIALASKLREVNPDKVAGTIDSFVRSSE